MLTNRNYDEWSVKLRSAHVAQGGQDGGDSKGYVYVPKNQWEVYCNSAKVHTFGTSNNQWYV